MSALAPAWAALVLLLAWHRRPAPTRLGALVRRSRPDGRTTTTGAGRSGPAFADTRRAMAGTDTESVATVAPGAPRATTSAPVDQRHRRGRARAGIAALVIASIAAGAVWPPLAVVSPAVAIGRRRWIAARRRRLARTAAANALPDVVDLLVVAIGAGLTPTLAVRQLAALAPPPFAAAFAEVDRRVGHGQRLADALTALVDDVGEPIRPVVASIASAERYGAPLGPTLELLAHEARHERRRRAEEVARTLPVKLCFPLVGCILPAFVLLTIAPLIAGALRSLTV
jgi:tight adherence protein C